MGPMADARPKGAHSKTIRRVPRMLVLDDDDGCRKAAERWFVAAGYAVTSAASPGEALAAFDLQPFDAFVTDMWLEDASTAEILRDLAERSIPLPPTVCITGDGDAARNPVWAFVPPSHRPVRFFDKPADFARVEAVLRALLDRDAAATG